MAGWERRHRLVTFSVPLSGTESLQPSTNAISKRGSYEGDVLQVKRVSVRGDATFPRRGLYHT